VSTRNAIALPGVIWRPPRRTCGAPSVAIACHLGPVGSKRRRGAAGLTSSCRSATNRAMHTLARQEGPFDQFGAGTGSAPWIGHRRQESRPSVMISRTKSKSVWLADREADLDLLVAPCAPTGRTCGGLRARGSIGSINAWLPSRRSTAHHSGALVDDAIGPGTVGQPDRLDPRRRMDGSGLTGIDDPRWVFHGGLAVNGAGPPVY